MGQNNKIPIKMITGSTMTFFVVGFLAMLTGVVFCNLDLSPHYILFLLGLSIAVILISFSQFKYTPTISFHLQKFCCYLAFICGFIGPALFPVGLGPFTLFPYRIFLLILLGLFTASSFIEGTIVLSMGRVKHYMIFFGFWLVYATFSLAWALDKGDAMRQLFFLFSGVLLLFFVTYYFHSLHDLNKLFWIWLGAFAALIILGCWEHLTGNHLPVSGYYGELRPWIMYRPTGVFKNPNDFATFLSLSIPFSLVLARYSGTISTKLAGIGTAFAAFYLIVATGSRANILAVLLMVLFLLLFIVKLKQKVKVAVVLTVFLMLMVIFGLASPIQEFAMRVAAELSSLFDRGGGSVAVRFSLVRNGLVFLLSTGGLGVGAGNAEFWMAKFARHSTSGILNPHNWWLEILVDYGVIVFCGYLVVYVGIVRTIWLAWRKAVDRKERMIAESLLLSLIGFSLASISSSSIMAFNPQWMLLAFAVAYLNYNGRPREEEIA
ncbi:MAG: O-antigen ligase family protein [Dethiobacteria bacterium]|nr:O-antigen ligase family protein [Acholeplasmataceae bacterium]